jgi:hypothetical protein
MDEIRCSYETLVSIRQKLNELISLIEIRKTKSLASSFHVIRGFLKNADTLRPKDSEDQSLADHISILINHYRKRPSGKMPCVGLDFII